MARRSSDTTHRQPLRLGASQGTLVCCVPSTIAIAPVGSEDCPRASVRIGPQQTWPDAHVTIRGAAWRTCEDRGGGCLPRTSSASYEGISVSLRPEEGDATNVGRGSSLTSWGSASCTHDDSTRIRPTTKIIRRGTSARSILRMYPHPHYARSTAGWGYSTVNAVYMPSS